MKAAKWYGRNDVRIEEVSEDYVLKPNQVRLKVFFAGICGTDLHEYNSGPISIPVKKPHPLTNVKAPIILGHEMSGKVVEVGDLVTRVKAGDRVAVCPIIGCQTCYLCKAGLMGLCEKVAFLGLSWEGGAFSSYVTVYDYMCYKLPQNVSYEAGALVEPLSATVRAIKQGRLKSGETVVIIGAGPIGLMAIQSSIILGAKKVIVVEKFENRKKIAIKMGASIAIDPAHKNLNELISELTDGAVADLVIECAGRNDSGLLATKLARTKGRVVIMGVFEKPELIDFTDIVYGEKTVIGSMGGYGEYDNTIKMIAAGNFNINLMITGKISLGEIIEKGFLELIEHKKENIKILISLF